MMFTVTGTPRQFVCTLDDAALVDADTLEAGLGATQMWHANYTVAEVIRRKLPLRVAVIALETEMTESGLRMYANGNNATSLKLPHEAVGWDHGSVGLYQQQVGGAPNSTADWGTTAQLMNVAISTDKFLNALARINWASMTNWDAAQRVQGSFDPTGGNYKRNDATATALATQLWEQNMPLTAADAERVRLAVVTTDIKNGPGVNLLYEAIGNTQTDVAAIHAAITAQTAVLNRIATHLGA